ncbi:telomere stability and silencing-domain-containing protein [Tirmania nivea]|nr:telomere stability and silencing-domain-containing protein [Tirmania nivea]
MSSSIPEATMINALISTFPGLPSLSIPLPPTASILSLHNNIAHRISLPSTLSLRLTTTSGKELPCDSTHPISSLLNGSTLLPLSLLPSLPGGKGGFGSQLRAAGGRMSSRKKRGQEENSDSCRNLDGRRIRTVKEAKALAAYLEIKPEMDKKEREKRKERWRKVVEQADRREAEERGDAVMGGMRFENTEWLEKTEEEKERLREAVVRAMKEGAYEDEEKKRDRSPGSSGISSGADEEEVKEPKKSKIAVPKPISPIKVSTAKARKFTGFDDDDEFMSDDGEEVDEEEMEDTVEENEEEEPTDPKGKGKGKARAT